MKMFEGRIVTAWIMDLKAAGWPDVAAEEIGEFLAGTRREPPAYRPDYWERRQALKERRENIE